MHYNAWIVHKAETTIQKAADIVNDPHHKIPRNYEYITE